MDETKIILDIEAGEAKRTIGDVRKELKQTKDEMAHLSGDEFLLAAKKAGELLHQLDEISQAVRGASSDFGDMLGNIAKTSAGITGAFLAAKGAMNLFGIESENVTEAIAKMLSIMAMTQGLAAIDEGIKAFRKLDTVIKTTSGSAKVLNTVLLPKWLLAISAAIGGIVLVWNKFHTEIENAIPLVGKVSEYFRDLSKDTDDAANAQRRYTEAVAEAEGKLEELLLKRKLSKLNDEAKKSYNDLASSIEEAQAKLDVVVAKQLQAGISRQEWEELNKEGLGYLEQIRLLKTQQDQLLASNASYVLSTKQKTKAIKEEKDATAELKLVKDTWAQDAYAEIEYNKAINKEYANSKLALEDLLFVQTEELTGLDEGTAAWYKLATLIELTKQALESYNQLAEETTDATNQITDATGKTEIGFQQIAQVGQMAFGALGDTLAAFADMQDTTTKEGFEQLKKLQIATVTMDMLGGVLSAWTSAMSPANEWMSIWGQLAMGIALTTSTIAMGAAQIQKIKSTTFENAGNPSTSVNTPSMSSAAVNVSSPVQYTLDVQGANIETAIKDTKVYVTESDISNTQRKVNVAESESRF